MSKTRFDSTIFIKAVIQSCNIPIWTSKSVLYLPLGDNDMIILSIPKVIKNMILNFLLKKEKKHNERSLRLYDKNIEIN